MTDSTQPIITTEPWDEGSQRSISINGEPQIYAGFELSGLAIEMVARWYAADPARGAAPVSEWDQKHMVEVMSGWTDFDAIELGDAEGEVDEVRVITVNGEEGFYYDPRSHSQLAREFIEAYNATHHTCRIATLQDGLWRCTACNQPIVQGEEAAAPVA